MDIEQEKLLKDRQSTDEATLHDVAEIYVAGDTSAETICQLIEMKQMDAARATVSVCEDINAYNEDGFTPLLKMMFVSSITKNNLPYGTTIERAPNEPLSKDIETFIKAGADVKAPYLSNRNEMSNYDGVPDFVGATAMHIAAGNGDVESIALLKEAGADVNATTQSGTTPLMWAVRNNQAEAAQKLIDLGADVDAKTMPDKELPRQPFTPAGTSVLEEAAWHKSYESAKVLLDNGADVDDVAAGAYSPLGIASKLHDILMIELFLDAGADINKPSGTYVETPLSMAVSSLHHAEKRLKTAELLLANGAAVNVRDAFGHTPLTGNLFAFYNDDEKALFELLLKHGADINMPDNDGKTLLHKTKQLSLFEYFVQHGAHLMAKDKKGNTAFEVAPKEIQTVISLREQIKGMKKLLNALHTVSGLMSVYAQMKPEQQEKVERFILGNQAARKITAAHSFNGLTRDNQKING